MLTGQLDCVLGMLGSPTSRFQEPISRVQRGRDIEDQVVAKSSRRRGGASLSDVARLKHDEGFHDDMRMQEKQEKDDNGSGTVWM